MGSSMVGSGGSAIVPGGAAGAAGGAAGAAGGALGGAGGAGCPAAAGAKLSKARSHHARRIIMGESIVKTWCPAKGASRLGRQKDGFQSDAASQTESCRSALGADQSSAFIKISRALADWPAPARA